MPTKQLRKEEIVYDYVRGEAYLRDSGYVVGKLVSRSLDKGNGNVTLRTEDEELFLDVNVDWVKMGKRSTLWSK